MLWIAAQNKCHIQLQMKIIACGIWVFNSHIQISTKLFSSLFLNILNASKNKSRTKKRLWHFKFYIGEKTANVKESNYGETYTYSERMGNLLLRRTLSSQIIFTFKPKLRLMVSGHCMMYSQKSEVQKDLSWNGDWLIS